MNSASGGLGGVACEGTVGDRQRTVGVIDPAAVGTA